MLQQQEAEGGLRIYGLQLEVVVHLTARGGWRGGLSGRDDVGVVCWKVQESCWRGVGWGGGVLLPLQSFSAVGQKESDYTTAPRPMYWTLTKVSCNLKRHNVCFNSMNTSCDGHICTFIGIETLGSSSFWPSCWGSCPPSWLWVASFCSW